MVPWRLRGAAAWHLVAVTQWLLGIRPELDGRPLDGGVVPPVPLGSEVRVEAVLEGDEG